MIEYFRPIPIVAKLSTTVWGASVVGPRDPQNGIEDPGNYFYWDGKIIKADDGKYHLFCSRWPHSATFSPGWITSSTSVHAVSDNAIGPYKNETLTYDYQGGKGHNTTAVALEDGTYAVIESAIVPGWIFTASSLDGPFNYLGSITWNGNGYNPDNVTSNTQITIGPDHKLWTIGGSGFVLNGTKLLGPYEATGPSVYPQIPGMNNGRAEDPVIWYSGGYYHVVYNYWDARKSYHVMSKDGIHDWGNPTVAVDRTTDFIRYTDGTVNHWGNMERPNVVMEDGHVAYFTFAVTDVNKDGGAAPDASKVIVVPFDGVSFDADNGGEPAGSGGSTGTGGGTGTGGASGGGGATTGTGEAGGGTAASGGARNSGGSQGSGGARSSGSGADGTASITGSSGGAAGGGVSTASSGRGTGAGGMENLGGVVGTAPGNEKRSSTGCGCTVGESTSDKSARGVLSLSFGALILRRDRRRMRTSPNQSRARRLV